MVGLLTLYCRLDFRWYCSVSPGALRIRKLRGDGHTDGRNDLRDRTKGFLSVLTVGWEWAVAGHHHDVGYNGWADCDPIRAGCPLSGACGSM